MRTAKPAQKRTCSVTVHGWLKYNPRTNSRRPYWFKLSNTLVEDEDFFDLSGAEFRAWIYVLSMCSRANSEKFDLNFDRASRVARISPRSIKSVLVKLSAKKILSFNETDEKLATDLQPTCNTLALDSHSRLDKKRLDKKRLEETATSSESASEAAVLIGEILPDLPKELIGKIRVEAALEWRKLYPGAWIKEELCKVVCWCAANPLKTPKSNWTRFINGWLMRGWESHRKSLASKPYNRAEQRSVGNMQALREAMAEQGVIDESPR